MNTPKVIVATNDGSAAIAPAPRPVETAAASRGKSSAEALECGQCTECICAAKKPIAGEVDQ